MTHQKTNQNRTGGSQLKGLLLHRGTRLKTREEVFDVPAPEATESWDPLSHESFVTRMANRLAAEGISVNEECLALSANGRRLFGLLELEMKGFVQRDYRFVLGLRNYYIPSYPSAVCVGASFFDNLSFWTEISFDRDRAVNLSSDLGRFVAETVAVLPAKFLGQALVFEFYRRAHLTDRQVHDLAIRFLDSLAIRATDIPRLLEAWRTPRQPEFAQADKTAWRLFNVATAIVQGDLWRLPLRTRIIHSVLDQERGLMRKASACNEVALCLTRPPKQEPLTQLAQ